MLAAIELDRKLHAATGKIDDTAADHKLTGEPRTEA
jgi:hypothetical protein